MTTSEKRPATAEYEPPAVRWPALAAAAWVGAFCVIAGSALIRSRVQGASSDGQDVVVLAIGLRLVTVVLALASIQSWGRRLPDWLVLGGLWGAAAVQIVYPVAETLVKVAILAGLMEPLDKGISNMTAEGWFNFGATWLVWGVPGALFAVAAVTFGRRVPHAARWAVLAIMAGLVLLGGLGLLIG
ncbi:hypothetical protein [Cellulomonas cellasea]|uniref:Uncharacterized protein n=1 Tax=Cellulomonas cellasea TaxID=43670 RepID=A0A7W4UJY8_9CELL|nr:hypothetical protein [Cellulomonas cellasea]MBB2925530.1 hypothetical protein [Cellulomonas cellasea]